MKCLLFIYGITDLKLEKIGEAIRPYAKEEMGFISMNKSAIINIEIADNIIPEVVLEETKRFTQQPVFLIDVEYSRMAFTMSNEQSLALFDVDFDSLCLKHHESGGKNPLIDEFEDYLQKEGYEVETHRDTIREHASWEDVSVEKERQNRQALEQLDEYQKQIKKCESYGTPNFGTAI